CCCGSGDFNCYKDRPWGYLESEEYIEHYGISPVWSNYRRNQKGGIPPQKTRNTCIRRHDMWEPLSNLLRHHHPLSGLVSHIYSWHIYIHNHYERCKIRWYYL
uniref:Uncharacterized protein n=1 Tax=Oncorhynchus tshawytscha TaxID=74940 RepID=A0AAZ3RVR5_ONCTS